MHNLKIHLIFTINEIVNENKYIYHIEERGIRTLDMKKHLVHSSVEL